MPTDDDVELCDGRVEVELLKVVKDVDQGRASFDDCRQRQLRCPGSLVDVSSDGDQRRHRAELFEDLRLADIAGVEDQVGSAESRQRLRTHEAVGIGDQADDVRVDHAVPLPPGLRGHLGEASPGRFGEFTLRGEFQVAT